MPVDRKPVSDHLAIPMKVWTEEPKASHQVPDSPAYPVMLKVWKQDPLSKLPSGLDIWALEGTLCRVCGGLLLPAEGKTVLTGHLRLFGAFLRWCEKEQGQVLIRWRLWACLVAFHTPRMMELNTRWTGWLHMATRPSVWGPAITISLINWRLPWK